MGRSSVQSKLEFVIGFTPLTSVADMGYVDDPSEARAPQYGSVRRVPRSVSGFVHVVDRTHERRSEESCRKASQGHEVPGVDEGLELTFVTDVLFG